ncbi:glycine betaine ABC transporter substrate-binding protein [Shouchella shacheensis]|uniref:glycine betaine ABC transporter substrate-binding protein n=1 Tax=Shouchella shacheensis TaxID=1649580 RepID=UPI00073FEB8B|nr:glycine betaine ABC transporter substrate-binding protein [Shouchella shacheensis]
MNRKYVWSGMVSIGIASVLAACGDESTDAENEEGGVGEQVDYEIIGIDPGTGIMDFTEEAFSEYDLGEEWELVTSSDAVMTATLADAIENEEPIIVTGWEPHWKFTVHDLKFLDDPNLVYGEDNDVHTLVRHGLSEDLPGPYQLLDQFQFELDEQQQVMEFIEVEEMDPEEAARQWLEENPERVEEWTDGVQEGNGEAVELVLVNWADAEAATNMASVMLQDLGYEPTLTEVTINAMYEALASESADAMLASWLPSQQHIYDDYEGQFEDLGPNSTGTRIGLVVPEYMDIDSIGDLKEE